MGRVTYLELPIIVSRDLLVDVVKEKMEKRGWVFYGTFFGNGTFRFGYVLDAEGDDVPYETVRGLVEEWLEIWKEGLGDNG